MINAAEQTPTTTPEFFEQKYRLDRDPWNFTRSEYELGRYATILRALKGRRYHRAFEPGCSVGALTRQLAAICDHVDASDFAPSAVAQAKRHCAGLHNVSLEAGCLSTDTHFCGYDLIILSEIGYYFHAHRLAQIAGSIAQSLPAGSTLLACHWLGHSSDHVLSGDQVHDILEHTANLTLVSSQRHAGFRLGKWVRA